MHPRSEKTGYIRYDSDNMSTLCALLIDRMYAIREDGLAETNLTSISKPLGHCLSALEAGLHELCAVEHLPLGVSYSIRQVESDATHQVGGVIDLRRDSELMPVEEFKAFANEKQGQVVDMIKWTLVNRVANPNQTSLDIDEQKLINGAESFAAAFNTRLNEDIEVSVHDPKRNQTVLKSKLSKLTLQHPPPDHKRNLVMRGFVSGIGYSKQSMKFVREHNAGTVTIECPKPELVMPHLSLLASWSCLFEVWVSEAEYQNSRGSEPDLKYKLLEIKAVKDFDADEILDNLEVVAKSLAQLSVTSDEWAKKTSKAKGVNNASVKKPGNGKRKK
jgi:hypothetical protein